MGLPNIMDENVLSNWNKSQWKRVVKKRINEKCESELKESMKAYSKLKDGPMPKEQFKMKNYIKEMTVEDARTNFSIRSLMYRAKFNYRSDPKNADELWKCSSCMSGHIESQSHILHCEAYSELREGKDLKSDDDLVQYMKNVLIIREKLSLNK